MSTERLLREYVRALLNEEGDGGGGDYTAGGIMAAGATMNPYGVYYGSSEDLYKIFIKPFTDVIQTTVGKTKEMSVKTQTLLKVAFETVATTLIPVLRDDYADIFAKEKKQLEQIRSQYGEVYKSNWDAFLDDDVLVAAFFYAPAAFLTAAFVKKSPRTAAQLISVLSGGSLDGYVRRSGKRLGWDDRVVTGLGDSGRSNKDRAPATSGGGDMTIMDGVMHEDAEDADDQKPNAVKLFANDKLKSRLEKSNVVQKMEKAGKAVVRSTLGQVFKQAQGVMSAKSLQDLQNKTGSKLKGMEKLAQVPQQEREKAEQEILVGTKRSMREFYVKNLEAQVKKAVKAGVPENSPYVQDYMQIINKIKAL